MSERKREEGDNKDRGKAAPVGVSFAFFSCDGEQAPFSIVMPGSLDPGRMPRGRSEISIRRGVLRSAKTCVLKLVTARNLRRRRRRRRKR